MKKSVIALLLTVALTIGTVLGCFVMPVSASDSASSSASVVSYDASVVGPELQVAVNADGEVSTYKLYEMGSGTCVAETVYPIIAYAQYDSTKSYGVSVVDKNGVESSVTDIIDVETVTFDREYNPSNILFGITAELTPASSSKVHQSDYGKIGRLTDGDYSNTSGRWSSQANDAAVFDGVFDLNGTFSLGALCLYDFNGYYSTCPGAGTYLKISVYSNHKWTVAYELNGKSEILATRKTVDGRNCLYFDLSGIKGEAIRIVNSGANSADALSYNEITCSGVFVSDYADYNYFESVTDVTDGKVFEPTENCTNPWSGSFAGVTDNVSSSAVKITGPVEMELDLGGDFTLHCFEVIYEYNGTNKYYRTGSNVKLEVYYNGTWTEVFNHANSVDERSVVLSLDGVLAQKIRYSADGVHPSSDTVSILELSVSGYEINYKDSLIPTDNVFSGYTFLPTADANSKVWTPYTYDKITDGSTNYDDRFCTKNNSQVSNLHADATLYFGGKTVTLDTLTVNYGNATRCGKDIVIEVTYRGNTTTVLNHTHTETVSSETFELGGVLAQSVRLYISGSYDTDCIMILEMECTGAISEFTNAEEDNIIEGVPVKNGDTSTTPHTGYDTVYGYPSLTDGNNLSFGNRFSTATYYSSNTQPVVLDAIIDVSAAYDLTELRVYDFTPTANAYFGNTLKIYAWINCKWVAIYDYSTAAEIYAHRNGDHLSFDMKGINTSSVRVVASNNQDGKSVSVYEMRLSATILGYDSEIQERLDRLASVYDEGNILKDVPAENLTVSGATLHTNPTVKDLTNAFDGDLSTRYAVNDLAEAGSYSLTIDLKNPTVLFVLSIYDWHDSDWSATDKKFNLRSDSTKVEILQNGYWTVVAEDFILDANSGVTKVDLAGRVATAIRITYTNNSYAIESSESYSGFRYPTATIKEIVCTGQLSHGDILDSVKAIEETDTSSVFGLDEVKKQKLASIAGELDVAGATDEEILAKIAELDAIQQSFEAGYAPETDAYGDFNSYNISLAGNVGVNFYGDLTEDVLTAFPNASVVVRYDTIVDGVIATVDDVRAVSDLPKDGLGRYILDFNMAAAQMTDTVEIRVVFDGDSCGHHIKTTIKDYAQTILNGDYDDNLKAVVNAMLTYGAHAQNYFGYNTDNLAADVNADLGSVSEDAKITVSESTATGMAMSGWTLMLDSNVTVKTYVKLEDGYTASDYTVTVVTPSGETLNNVTLEAVGTRYRVTIEGIASGFLNDNYVITYTNNNDGTSMTVTSSAMCYVSAILASDGSDAKLVNLVKALKLYSVAADAYFGR